MPLYFTVVLIWSFVYRGYGRYFLLSSMFGANLSHLFGIHVPHGPRVLWSLAVEEHFYLLWPAIVFLLDHRKILFLCAAILIGSPILRGVYAAQGMNPEVIYDLSWFRFDGLATGAAMAIWVRSECFERTTAHRIVAGLLCALPLMSLVGARFGLFGTKTVVAVALRYTQAYLAFGASFILVLVYRGMRWTAFLRNRFMQLSGALSYCLYLIHLSLGDAYRFLISHQHLVHFNPTAAVFVRCGSMLIVSFGFAMLSHKYLEEPFLALKEKFSSRVSTRQNETARAASPAVEASG